MLLPTIQKAFPASLHKDGDFISFWFSKPADKQETHCYYSINWSICAQHHKQKGGR